MITKDKDTANRHRGRHFQIAYSIERDQYFIRDLGIGVGAFVKIEEDIIIKDNYLLSLGESFIIINILTERDESDTQSDLQFPMLRLKLFGGPSTGEVFFYKPKPNEKIQIGRMNNCHIQIEDSLLSKF